MRDRAIANLFGRMDDLRRNLLAMMQADDTAKIDILVDAVFDQGTHNKQLSIGLMGGSYKQIVIQAIKREIFSVIDELEGNGVIYDIKDLGFERPGDDDV